MSTNNPSAKVIAAATSEIVRAARSSATSDDMWSLTAPDGRSLINAIINDAADKVPADLRVEVAEELAYRWHLAVELHDAIISAITDTIRPAMDALESDLRGIGACDPESRDRWVSRAGDIQTDIKALAYCAEEVARGQFDGASLTTAGAAKALAGASIRLHQIISTPGAPPVPPICLETACNQGHHLAVSIVRSANRDAAQLVDHDHTAQQVDHPPAPIGITATMAGISRAVN